MGVRYEYLGVKNYGGEVKATFAKGPSGWVGKIFPSKTEIAEDERGCRDLYSGALLNEDGHSASLTSFDSLDDVVRGFNAIHAYKKENGIAVDFERID